MRKFFKWVRIILSVALILVGLSGIYKYFEGNKVIADNVEVNRVSNFTKEDLKRNNDVEATYDYDDVQVVDLDTVKELDIDPSELPTIAGVAIPSVDINLPVYKGVSNANMLYGAGTLRPDQEMGKNNYILASHNMYRDGLLFSPLENTKIGDKVYITDLEHIYVYKVYRNDLISQYDVHELNNTEQPIITLITCDVTGQYRYIVQGDLVDKIDYDDADAKILNYFNTKNQNTINE